MEFKYSNNFANKNIDLSGSIVDEVAICNFCGFSGPYVILETNVKNSNHTFVECPVCKLRFYSPRTSFKTLLSYGFGKDTGAQKEAEFFYKNLSFSPVLDRKVQEDCLRNYYGEMLKLLLQRKEIRTLFEIGGSIGFFSYLAKEQGIDVYGSELNSYAVEAGKKYLGLSEFVSGPFIEYQPSSMLYDCIVALDYIEHTYTPFDDLKKMNQMLVRGGVLLIKTFLEELDVDKKMVAPPYHSHHFFGNVLCKMLEKAGFSINYWKEEGDQVILIGKKE